MTPEHMVELADEIEKADAKRSGTTVSFLCNANAPAIIAALRLAAQQDGAWQDMETAPKNGTRIMLFEEKPVKQTSFARWVGAPHSVWIADQGNYIRRPTRWQPVPAPPAS